MRNECFIKEWWTSYWIYKQTIVPINWVRLGSWVLIYFIWLILINNQHVLGEGDMIDIQLKVLGRYKVSLVVKKKNKKKNYYKFDLLTKIIINIYKKKNSRYCTFTCKGLCLKERMNKRKISSIIGCCYAHHVNCWYT